MSWNGQMRAASACVAKRPLDALWQYSTVWHQVVRSQQKGQRGGLLVPAIFLSQHTKFGYLSPIKRAENGCRVQSFGSQYGDSILEHWG